MTIRAEVNVKAQAHLHISKIEGDRVFFYLDDGNSHERSAAAGDGISLTLDFRRMIDDRPST